MIYKILTIACASLFWLQATYCYGQLTVKPVVTHASCNGGSDGKIELQVSGTPPYSYSWSTGASTPEVSELNAGMYQVVVIDAKGRASELQVQLLNKSSLTLEKKRMIVPNEGISNGEIEVQVKGGMGPYTYFLSKYSNRHGIQRLKQTNSYFKGLAKGSYLLDVVDAKGCMTTLNINLK